MSTVGRCILFLPPGRSRGFRLMKFMKLVDIWGEDAASACDTVLTKVLQLKLQNNDGAIYRADFFTVPP